MLSFEKINNILKTLPIGYYLGRKINCLLQDSDQSYYDSFNDEIVVGFKQLPCVLINNEIDDAEIEKDIRCMLYHEISHVLMTPCLMGNNMIKERIINFIYNDFYENDIIVIKYQPLIKTLSKDNLHGILNIFEDQRIETILGAYFLNVNFPEFVKKVNHYAGPVIPKNSMDAFYSIVRFNEGPKEFIERVYSLIKTYSILKIEPTGYAESRKIMMYFIEVLKLYFDIEEYYGFNNKENEEKSTKTNGPATLKISGSNSSNSNINSNENIDLNNIDKVEIEIDGTENGTENETEENNKASTITLEELNELLNNIKEFSIEIKNKLINNNCIDFKNPQLNSKISNIILNAKRKKGLTASSHQTYYGKINPKYINRKKIEDYKWFDKPLTGSKSGSSKLQLNLFVDTSGSFAPSQFKINQLLYILNDLQKRNKNFVCKLITMSMTNELKPKVAPVECCGANKLTNEILDIYKRVQDKLNTNYNIVVFDGDAQSNLWPSEKISNEKAFSAWNHPNCVIISDGENQSKFDKWSPAAKRIYTKNYVEELEINIIKALNMLFK